MMINPLNLWHRWRFRKLYRLVRRPSPFFD